MHMNDRELQNYWLPAEYAQALFSRFILHPPLTILPGKRCLSTFTLFFFFFFDRHASYQSCVGNWEGYRPLLFFFCLLLCLSFCIFFFSSFLRLARRTKVRQVPLVKTVLQIATYLRQI